MNFIAETKDIVEAVWRLTDGLTPQVRFETIEQHLFDDSLIDKTKSSRTTLKRMLDELVKDGRLRLVPVDGPPAYATPKAPEDGLYNIRLKGEQGTYHLRGDKHHDAERALGILSDLTGYRTGYLEAVIFAALKPGEAFNASLGATAKVLVTRKGDGA